MRGINKASKGIMGQLCKRRTRAFTLADLVITALIIGILSAVATPKMISHIGELQLEAAAKKLAADLRYARQNAKTTGKNQSVTFDAAAETYELNGMFDVHHSTDPYLITVPDSSFPAEIDSAVFGGGSVLTFDMYGKPQDGGTVTLSNDGETRTVNVNAVTGEVTVS